jgi:signal transduction histidine kinase
LKNPLLNITPGILNDRPFSKDQSRVLAINSFGLLLLGFSIGYAVYFFFIEEWFLFKLVGSLGVLCSIPIILNLFKAYYVGRIWYTFQGPIFVLIYALLLGQDVAINYFFIVLFVFPFLFLKHEEIITSIIFFFYNFACLLFLEYGELPFITPYEMSPEITDVVKQLVLIILFAFVLILTVLFYQVIIKNEKNLINKTKEIEQASLVKQEFLAIMSHELRTPLNAVVSISNLLEENPNHPDKDTFLRLLKHSSNNLTTIINDILDFSKLEANKMRLELRPYNLKSLLQQITDMYRSMATEKGLMLSLHVDEKLGEVYELDDVRLGQVLGNLISNAIKYSNRGRVTVSATLEQNRGNRDLVKFAVRDQGLGIPASSFDDIFKSFTQLKSNLTRSTGGTGLGLAIVKKILALSDSDIYVQSEVGQGSVFYFSVSLLRADNLPSETGNHALRIGDKKILLVEDNSINALVAEKLIASWGDIKVEKATNGQLALDRCNSNLYDLILMDIHMPVMDGFAATRAIRTTENLNIDTPIYALTADVNSEMNEENNMFFDGFLTKPIQKEKLQAVLTAHLK